MSAGRRTGPHRPVAYHCFRVGAWARDCIRPDPRRGRSRRRFSLLLSVLALPLGALSLFAPTPAQAQRTVSLSASPNPVAEGNYVTVTATLSSALAGDVAIRVTSTNGTAEDDDYNKITSIRITAGETTGSKRIFTLDDCDTYGETFTVALREQQPAGVTVGSPSSVTVTVSDGDSSARASNANLCDLTASGSTSAGGTYTALTPFFTPSTRTSYTATVANATTHAKLTPTAADTSAARLTVDGTAVTSGSASGAIALSVGENPITVRVTAQDGTTKDYTVTITRQAGQQSSDATLSGLTASSSTSAGGTFSSLNIGTFSSTTTSYTATVANVRTHVKLTPTANHSAASITWRKGATGSFTPVTSGSATAAIALGVGANAITVRVTAQDGTTQDYTVTVTRQAQQVSNVPTGLSVTAGNAQLTASWTAPSGVDVLRYEAQIKLKSAANWPGADTDVTGTSHTFTGLTNGSPYQVRVRTIEVGEQTPSDWTAPAEGTPRAPPAVPAVSLSASPNPVPEGSSVTVTATLSSALSSNVAIPVTLTDGSAESGDYGTLTSITINSGATSGTGTIATAQDADAEHDETFTVALGTLPNTVTAGTPSSVEITIRDDDQPQVLRVDAIPACGTTVSDLSVRPSFQYVLTPAPSENVYAEYRVVTETSTLPWVTGASLPIVPGSGRSSRYSFDTFADLRRAYPGFKGFDYRLRDTHSVTTQCTWRFDDDGPTPPTPTVSLSASPNPVDEGSPVTVTARLSSALTSAVTIPLAVTAGTAESGDFGALASITIAGGSTSGTGRVTTSEDADADDETFTVALGSLPSSVRAGSPSSVTVEIRDGDGGTTPPTPTVSLSASPNPVDEGGAVTVTATLSSALTGAVTIPVSVTAGTAESGDYGTLVSITIDSGSRTGTGRITTSEDADTDDETFTVALGSLPSSVRAGSPRAVTVRIRDDDGGGTTPPTPTVSLSASPNPVDEGGAVTVTARLSSALSSRVTIPLTLSNGTAEPGDYGSLSSIAIDSGSRTGTGRIATSEDADTDDETFTVALGSLPSSVRAGSPRAVEVTILDDDPENRAPTVSASCDPCRVGPGGEVRLAARASDPDGDPLTYAWSAPAGRFAGPADEAAARWRAPAETGRVTIRVRVSDGRGGTASATVSVEVANAPPAFGEPCYAFELRENEDGRVRPVPLGAALAEDPDGDGVTYALASGAGHLFAVGAEDGAVTYVGPGEDYETEPNRYELTVRARDPHGAEALAPVVVEVLNVNEPPVAAADTAATPEDTEVEIEVLANDVDVEGDALRVESVTAPAHGTVRIAAGGGVVYAPEADWHGTDRFAYTVSDGNGGTAKAEVEVIVEPVNDVPEAAADAAWTLEDEGVEIDVLANDTDVEGDALSIESVTAPSHGTARIAARGGVAYAPHADWHGTDRFAYTVTDGNGGTATAEVEVVVEPVNDAPVPVADTAWTPEDTEVVIDVLANDVDVEGDALRVESVTAPAHGTVRIAAGGGVVYAPEADWHGTDRFAYAVSDGNGGTAGAEVEVVVEPVNDAPLPVGAIPEQSLDEGGAAAEFDLTPYFEDPDGDPLTYSASSSDPGVVAVAVLGSMLRVTPVGYGETSVEVTARDPGGLDARQTFRVGASDRMARLALDETFAAMGRAHLASARMTLGRRVGPGGGRAAGSMLTVMGRRVPLGRDAAREAAGRLLEGWAVSRLWRGGGLAEAGRTFEGRMAEWASAAADGSDGPADPAELAAAMGVGGLGAFPNPGGTGADGTEWMFAFGGQEGSARPGGDWRFWGQGDIQTFAGEPSAERGYEGDLRTGWAGLDRALGTHWLAGVAVARSSGGGDWRAGSAGGRLETSLTAVHPYLRWSDGATSLWAMAGGGGGSAENARATGRVGASSLGLRLGLFEARRRFTDWLGLRADAAWARLATGDGDETVDGRRAAVDQQRLGIELSPSARLGALAVEPFAEASARRDGGAGQTGSGLEVSGGLRAAAGPVRIDARGRILVLHSARGYEERGLGVTLTVGSPAAEEGLSLSVSPRWGGSATATGALWNDRHGALRPDAPAAAGPWALDARARYALRLPGGRLLAWSGGLARSADGYALTIGGGFEPAGPLGARPPR